jgi:hypothetical protein
VVYYKHGENKMKGKPLAIGNMVRYRLYNSVEHKFYDEYRLGVISDIQTKNAHFDGFMVREKMYWVTPDHMKSQPIWLFRREIKKVIDKKYLEKQQKALKELSEMEW